jgi:hypothetical protein
LSRVGIKRRTEKGSVRWRLRRSRPPNEKLTKQYFDHSRQGNITRNSIRQSWPYFAPFITSYPEYRGLAHTLRMQLLMEHQVVDLSFRASLDILIEASLACPSVLII